MTIDLTGLKVITLADIEAATQTGAKELVTAQHAILTPSAREALQARGLTLRSDASEYGAQAVTQPTDPRIAARDRNL